MKKKTEKLKQLENIEVFSKKILQLKGQSRLICSFFLEDNNGTIYLGVKHMLTELLQPKVGTTWCIYAI